MLAFSVKVNESVEDGIIVWVGAVKPVVNIYHVVGAKVDLRPASHLKSDEFMVSRYFERHCL